MFSIEVISNDLRWIAAIYEQPSEGDKYLEELISFGHKPKVVEITNISTFPVYAIEPIGEDSPANYFEYLSESEYLQLIEYQQKNRSINDNYEAYFTVFFFQDAHFQHPYENSLMGALDHVHVSNYYLDSESANLSLNDTYIDRLVNNYDIEALFNLVEKLKNSSDKEAKTNLADGLVSLYAQMDYDHACGKLTTEGINSLLPILERAELLYDKPIDDCFSRAYLIMLEESVKKNAPEEEIKKFMEKAIEVNESMMHTSPEEQQDAYKQLAMVFETILEHKPSANYLEQAYLNIRKSIATAPTNGDWELYLKLIFVPIAASDSQVQNEINSLQLLEKATFENFAEDQFRKNSNVSMNICKSLDQLKEHIAWKKLPEQLFPEDLYLPWLNQVLNWEIKSITKIEAHENAHFLHNEGVRLERIDLLEKAEEIYQRLIDATESPAFEIYYLASNTEAISDIYLKQGELEKAYLFRNKTTEIYQSNLDSIINNYSTHSHYTEYLFRNYFFDGPIIKSSANDLEKHATMCEDEGKGHYSKPTMLRITLALHENKEDKAIFLMARLLILLEQLFDETQNCLNHTDESLFPKFHSFLSETLAFFKETENGYYYDPKLRWDDVKDLSPETIIDTWEERKAELREKFKS